MGQYKTKEEQNGQGSKHSKIRGSGGERVEQISVKAMDWLGLRSGIGIIGISAWWFIWCLFSYIFVSPQNVIQQQVHEYFFIGHTCLENLSLLIMSSCFHLKYSAKTF